MNLAVNARDAIEESGKVTLSTRNIELGDEKDGQPLDLAPGSYVLLEMTDTGVGMSRETLFRIFEPFFTTKGQDKGTGLGLSTVYGIVKQSGGDIAVDSEKGRGTAFRIYLPVALDLNAAMAPVRTERGPAKGVETILLVEDDDTVRYLTKRLLERAGYTVLPAGHGGEALRVCEQYEGPIHLIVTDVVMPEMGGLALVERLLARHPEMRAVFMSGYSDAEVVQIRETVAQVAFLQKPFSYKELTQKVRGVLDSADEVS
jgi:CheY-like chemotaxis protein